MKKYLLSLLCIALCGCDITPKNTHRQAVVDKYGEEAEIIQAVNLPVNCFYVRDTNNAIWYVETKYNNTTLSNSVRTSTLIFRAQR